MITPPSTGIAAKADEFVALQMLQHHLPSDLLSKGANLTKAEIDDAVDKQERKHQQELAALLGLNLDQGGDDQVKWNRKGLGLQSRSFQLTGSRWKGLGGQVVTDTDAAANGTAFAKVLSSWTVEAYRLAQQESGRKEAEECARELGKSNDEVVAAGERAAQEAMVDMAGITETWLQMKHERTFLRAWAQAEAAGELKLPEDSLLVIPRLFDNVVVNGEAAAAEEEKPSALVLEDLIAAGFEARHYWNPLSYDDAVAVALALGDFHAAMWRIHERLDAALADFVPSLTPEQAETHKKVRGWMFKRNMKTCLDSMNVKSMRELLLPLLDDMADVLVKDEEEMGFCIYGHGDPWAHNMLLRRDPESGKVTGVAFVDFGSVKRMSPLIDFYGFLATSVRNDSFYVRPADAKTVPTVYSFRMVLQLPDCIRYDENGRKFRLYNGLALSHAHAMVASFFWNNDQWYGPIEADNPSQSIELPSRQYRFFMSFFQVVQRLKAEGPCVYAKVVSDEAATAKAEGDDK
jgi:hypothetical protein